MPLIGFTMVLLMGLCLYAGAHFLFHFKYSYKTNSTATLYFIFGTMCFLIFGFMGAELLVYRSHDPATYVKAFQWRIAFGLLFLILWPWFIHGYTLSGPRWLAAGLSAYLGLHWVLNWLLPYGVMLNELPTLIEKTLPWGETITFHGDRHLTFLSVTGWVGVIAVIVYGFYASVRQYRGGQHRRAMSLAVATAVFAVFLLENLLVLSGALDFVFLAQYGFPSIIIVMGAALHREALTQAWRIQAVVDHVPAVVYLKNADGRYLVVNRQYESLLDVADTRIVGKTDLELFDRERADVLRANDRAVLNSGTAMEFEETVQHANGTVHTYQSVKFPIHDANSDSDVICGISNDITERKQAEDQLVQSETKFRTLFETAGDAILLMRGECFIDCNLHALTLFGCAREDLVGNTPMAFSPSDQYGGRDSKDAALEKINAALAGENQFFPWRHCKLDGTLFDAEVSLNRIELDGQPCLQAIVRDVTLRKRNEEAIKNIAAGVSAATGDSFFRQLVVYLGKLFDTKYSFIGLIDKTEPLTVNTLALCVDGEIADNISYRLENTPCANVVGKSTCAYPAGVQQTFPKDTLLQQLGVESYIGTPLFDAVGKPLGLIVLLDNKPQQQIEWMGEILQIFAARAAAELERIRAVQDLSIKERAMEAATEGIVLMDAAHNNGIVYANHAMEHITGYPRQELLGQSQQLFEGPDTDSTTKDQLYKALAQHQPCHVEILHYRKDGTPFWNEITITPVRNEAGEVTHFIATQLDITQRRQTEDILRRSQKMEALGEMAGGIAHDFNNRLGIIIGYLDFLRTRLVNEDKPLQWVDTASRSTLHCIELTRQLLSFSRRQTTGKNVTDLGDELTKMNTLITRTVTPAITVRIVPNEGVWPVAINPGEFQDAILNLLINARDAMPEGGQIVIEVTNKVMEVDNIGLIPGLNPGDYVQVKISDTGQGMDKVTLERVFEPFFTTKPEGKGTGLGLAMVYGFVKRYGGEIQVESEVGVGTSFEIYLPRMSATPHVDAVIEPQSQSLPGGTETILIVDDEVDLLQLAKQYLEPLGYCTLTANNSMEALSILEKRPDIDLLFSDVVMPGSSNGYVLAEQAIAIHPSLKVLLASGYTANTVAINDQARFTEYQLRKPYRQDELAKCIRAVLDKKAVDENRRLQTTIATPNGANTRAGTSTTTTRLAGRTILVVDDDQDIRDLFKINLEKLGCNAIPARDGQEAVKLYSNSLKTDKPIDVIILDLNLSATSMDGKKIADTIRSLDPTARLIVASGHSESPEMSRSFDYGFHGAIKKDFDREVIRQVLTKVLAVH